MWVSLSLHDLIKILVFAVKVYVESLAKGQKRSTFEKVLLVGSLHAKGHVSFLMRASFAKFQLLLARSPMGCLHVWQVWERESIYFEIQFFKTKYILNLSYILWAVFIFEILASRYSKLNPMLLSEFKIIIFYFTWGYSVSALCFSLSCTPFLCTLQSVFHCTSTPFSAY